MQVDPADTTRYDEHYSAPEREVITVETKIKPSNKGFAMLAKMGWVEGQPVGLSGEGENLCFSYISTPRIFATLCRAS